MIVYETEDKTIDYFLEHHGVKGMRWGQRKDRAPGVSRQVNKSAQKDAHEFARAKAFFGEGAGTRRKLIKQTVDAKTQRVPGYKKAFDHHLSKQDMSKHAEKAVSERSRTDFKVRNKQRAGFLARKFTGEMGTQAAITASVLAGAAFVSSPKGRATMSNVVKKGSKIVNSQRQKRGAAKIADFLKNST